MAATNKILRNRIVGLLIILSLILILVPAMMSPEDIYKKDPGSIAVNQNGVAEKKQEGLRDYNDLLAPEDDLKGSGRQDPMEIARQNSQTPVSEPESALPLNQPADLSGMDDGNPFLDSTVSRLPPPDVKPQGQIDYLGNTGTEAQGEDRMGDFVKQLEQKGAPAQDTAQNRTPPRAVTPPKPQNSPKAAPTATPKAENSAAKGFIVQVGVFSKRENAQNVIAKLKQGGVSARQESTTLNGKSVFRVYAGSAGSRQNAEATAAKVKAITGSEARVVNLGN